MSKASKRKIEFMISQDEVSDFFRRLADGVDSGGITVGETAIHLSGLQKISVSMKTLDDVEGLRVKMKLRYCADPALEGSEELFPQDPEDDAEAEYEDDAELDMAGAKPRYTHLKKRMKAHFKAIQAAVSEGQLPERGVVNDFVRDSELMITYPGKGDEFYGAYRRATEQFMVAVTEGDLAAVAATVDELERQKQVCHDKHE